MKKILVPTDFSETSHDAFLFAVGMAEELGADLKVVHVYSGTFQPDQPLVLKAGMGRTETIESHLQDFINKKTDEQKGNVITKTKIEIEAISAVSITKKLIKLTQDPDLLMVIMGTKGQHDVIEKVWGSVSTALAKKAACPVLLIPKGKKYEPFKSILFASNYESADEEMLEDIMYVGNLFRSTLHFVHVEEPNDNYEKGAENIIFDKLFEKGDSAFAFNMATIQSTSVAKGLTQYADENNVDLLVLVHRERDFLSNLMERSVTQQMGLYTELPLMVFHI